MTGIVLASLLLRSCHGECEFERKYLTGFLEELKFSLLISRWTTVDLDIYGERKRIAVGNSKGLQTI